MSGPQKPGGTPEPEPPLEGSSEFLLYQTEDGHARVHVRLDGDTVWLTQATLAELYQTTPQNITLHINAIYDEGELDETATCKDYLQVRQEGTRRVQRRLKRRPMYMADWIAKLDDFLRLSDRELLTHPGKISHEAAAERAACEFDRFEAQRRALPSPVERHFDAAVHEVKLLEKARPRRGQRK